MWIRLTAPLDLATLSKLQAGPHGLGLMPAHSGVAAFASRAHWGIQSVVFPEEGATVKLWKFNNAPEGGVRFIAIKGALKASDPATYSDAMWALYGAAASRMADLYRQYAPYFDALGGIPRLVEVQMDKAEAERINVREGPTVPYPLGNYEADTPVFPAFVLRFKPGNAAVVEAAHYQEFAAWMASEFRLRGPATATTPAPASGSASTAPAPALPFAPATGRTPLGPNRFLEWRGGVAELVHVASEGEDIRTGFTFVNKQGGFGQGGAWQDHEPNFASLNKLAGMLAPFVVARGGRVIGFGAQKMDGGVNPDPTIVIEAGGKRVEIPASPLIEAIAAKMNNLPLSTGAVPATDAPIKEALDQTWASL